MTPNKRGVLKVEYVPIKSVKPAKGNTRIHPPEQASPQFERKPGGKRAQ